MSDVADLIERAASRTNGNLSELARRLQVPVNHVNDWKHGRRTCTPEDRALLAAAAGEDAMQELIRAALAKHAGTKKGDLLQKVLGKPLHQTGAAIVTVLPVLASLSYGVMRLLNTMCIM